MAEEARALQIRLAQLQSDIRIYSTGIFASAAAVLTLVLPVYSYGIAYWETMTISIPKIIVSILFIVLAIVFAYAAFGFYEKMKTLRNELNNLK